MLNQYLLNEDRNRATKEQNWDEHFGSLLLSCQFKIKGMKSFIEQTLYKQILFGRKNSRV